MRREKRQDVFLTGVVATDVNTCCEDKPNGDDIKPPEETCGNSNFLTRCPLSHRVNPQSEFEILSNDLEKDIAVCCTHKTCQRDFYRSCSADKALKYNTALKQLVKLTGD